MSTSDMQKNIVGPRKLPEIQIIEVWLVVISGLFSGL